MRTITQITLKYLHLSNKEFEAYKQHFYTDNLYSGVSLQKTHIVHKDVYQNATLKHILNAFRQVLLWFSYSKWIQYTGCDAKENITHSCHRRNQYGCSHCCECCQPLRQPEFSKHSKNLQKQKHKKRGFRSSTIEGIYAFNYQVTWE